MVNLQNKYQSEYFDTCASAIVCSECKAVKKVHTIGIALHIFGQTLVSIVLKPSLVF